MIPYIRVKRRNQTVFVDVQPSDSFLSVKEKLGALFGLPPAHIQLWQGLNQVGCLLLSPSPSPLDPLPLTRRSRSQKESKEFADAAALADHDIQNDAIVYMCWKKESTCAAVDPSLHALVADLALGVTAQTRTSGRN
jgi:hypothetical protein